MLAVGRTGDRLTFTTPPYNHNAIEPHATIAVWHGDEHLTVYDTSQFTAGTAGSLSQAFGLKKENVRLLAPFVGGGFGGKGGIWPNTQLCAMAARLVKRPVRIALSRAGVFRIVGGRTPSRQRVAIAADGDGQFTAFIHEGVTAQSTDNHFPEQFSFPPRHLYAMPSFRIGQKVTEVNRVANTFMRAPGESIGTFAVESAIDALAYKLKMDPIVLRSRNEPDSDPVSGLPFSSRFMQEAYRLGAERFRWHERPAAVRSQRDGDWLVGQGVATGTYPVYRMVDGRPSSSQRRRHGDHQDVLSGNGYGHGDGADAARGRTLWPLAGQNPIRVWRQHAACRQRGGRLLADRQHRPGGPPGRRLAPERTADAGAAVARIVLTGVPIDQLHMIDDGIFLRDRPSVGETYAGILGRAGRQFVEAEVKTGSPLEMMKYSMHSYAAQFCEAAVHAYTGEVRIRRWVGAFDTGRIINPKTAVSQFRGGIVMGIGMALTEETIFDDRTGRIVNASLSEYHVPVEADVPHIDVVYTDAPIRTRLSARTGSAKSGSRGSLPPSPTRSFTPPACESPACRSRWTSCCKCLVLPCVCPRRRRRRPATSLAARLARC